MMNPVHIFHHALVEAISSCSHQVLHSNPGGEKILWAVPGAEAQQDVAVMLTVAVMLRTAHSPSQTMHPTPGGPKSAGYHPLSLLCAFISLAMKR